MGLDEDPERFPWRYEHFGMTTAEAMAAEAVPFVLAAGGQREIVTHEENGFLWHSLEQLKQQIRAFMTIDPAVERRLRKAARERALDFSDKMFYNRTCAMYRSLGIECLAPDAIADTAL
jgi:glycosyltransferase involved in cell wall biosynthesis